MLFDNFLIVKMFNFWCVFCLLYPDLKSGSAYGSGPRSKSPSKRQISADPKSLVKKTDKDPKFDEKKVDVWKEEDDIVLNLRTFRSLKKFKWLTVFR